MENLIIDHPIMFMLGVLSIMIVCGIAQAYIMNKPQPKHETDHEFKQAKRLINYQSLINQVNRPNQFYVNDLESQGFNVDNMYISKNGIPLYCGDITSNGVDVYRAVDNDGNMEKIGHTSKKNYYNYVLNDDILVRW